MIIWSIIFAICLIGEVIILVLSIFIKNSIVQFLIFVVLSLIFLLLLRDYCKKFVKIKDRLPREQVCIVNLVDEDKDGNFKYEVRYKGAIWTAISKEKFIENDKAHIKGFEGNKIKL